MDDTYKQKSREQKEYYNRTADSYDEWHVNPPSAKVVDDWNFKNLRKFLGANKIKRALELGSGTGRLANNLLKIAEEVYGVDQSAEVLKIAQEKYPKLKLTCAEVIDLPYKDNYFDLVIINGSLHHFFAVKATFAEAHRVLKPGGAFVLLGEPNSHFMKLYNPFFYLWIMDRFANKVFSQFSRKNLPSEPIEPDAESYVPEQLKQQLIEANFDVKRFYTYDYISRSDNKLWLKYYQAYLNFENKNMAVIFPGFGMAIQAFAIKKK